jgi:long-chain acyl-CoA synthetase
MSFGGQSNLPDRFDQAKWDGEIQFKGRNVMPGYYKMPEETAATFTGDGWLRTGDLGEIDEENFLRITGRKKELIITSGGKNIAPAAIEGMIAASRYINQVCVLGDGRKFLRAVASLDPDAAADYARTEGIPFTHVDDLAGDPKIQALVEAEVAGINKGLPSFETIKKVTVVPEFTIENAMMTPTMKLRKKVIMDRYKEDIEAMYK